MGNRRGEGEEEEEEEGEEEGGGGGGRRRGRKLHKKQQAKLFPECENTNVCQIYSQLPI